VLRICNKGLTRNFVIYDEADQQAIVKQTMRRMGLDTKQLEQFRNYCGLIKIARSGFPWEKTTKRPVASVYTNCETALAPRTFLFRISWAKNRMLDSQEIYLETDRTQGTNRWTGWVY
jgi:superfamily I DNA/RNA helicase